MSELDLLLRLLAATVLGGVLGFEREFMNRAAGLRTHVMVSIGAALFTILSIYYFTNENGPRDSARVAAQIVSGIGFLGAGAIMKHGATVRGLTTAATLWVVAAIGMGCGAGAYFISAVTCAISLLTLIALRRLEGKVANSRTLSLSATFPNRAGIMERFRQTFTTSKSSIGNIDFTVSDDLLTVNALLLINVSLTKADIAVKLSALGATSINLDS